MRIILVLLMPLMLFAGTDPDNKNRKKKKWKLTWSEEFNYNGMPDSTKWTYDTGGDGWGNNELQYYTEASPKNVQVSNGSLKIKAIKEDMGGKNFTSTRLITRGKAGFTYGKIEIRAKLPPGRGLWPAIWMLGDRVTTVDWPECGEIDIMEHVGFEKDSIFGTVHTKSYNHVIGTQKTKKAFIKDPYTSFHVYSIEWTPEKMDFLLDGKVFNHFANEHKTVAEWPFDFPFYLVLNIAVGGNLGGMKGLDENVFPATLEVDYVRVYSNQN